MLGILNLFETLGRRKNGNSCWSQSTLFEKKLRQIRFKPVQFDFATCSLRFMPCLVIKSPLSTIVWSSWDHNSLLHSHRFPIIGGWYPGTHHRPYQRISFYQRRLSAAVVCGVSSLLTATTTLEMPKARISAALPTSSSWTSMGTGGEWWFMMFIGGLWSWLMMVICILMVILTNSCGSWEDRRSQ